jgi:hypothetical protein
MLAFTCNLIILHPSAFRDSLLLTGHNSCVCCDPAETDYREETVSVWLFSGAPHVNEVVSFLVDIIASGLDVDKHRVHINYHTFLCALNNTE